jgi:hypothetical protein
MSATPTSAKKQISTDVNFSPERSYPGKGVGYDWQAVLAEVEAAHLDRELLSLEVVPSE